MPELRNFVTKAAPFFSKLSVFEVAKGVALLLHYIAGARTY
jgi:hypothetical protein